jgi:hypothetical protein
MQAGHDLGIYSKVAALRFRVNDGQPFPNLVMEEWPTNRELIGLVNTYPSMGSNPENLIDCPLSGASSLCHP